MSILVDKNTADDAAKYNQKELIRANAPWVKNYDPQTGEIEWDNAEMNKLKAAITASVNKNDAILNSVQGEVRDAVKKGYILINYSGDGMPNWHDIRIVILMQGTGAVLDIIGGCPGAVIRQAMTDLYVEGKLKRIEPRQVKS